MADYISREAVLELIDNAPIIAGNENETLISAPKLSDEVYCITAADVRPVVRGKWKFEIGDGKTCVDGWVCTNCNCGFHTNVPYFEEFNFCPNCGAEMSDSQTLKDASQYADAGAMAPAT